MVIFFQAEKNDINYGSDKKKYLIYLKEFTGLESIPD